MLATLADFKAYLNVDVTDTSSDSLYTGLLTRAQAEVEDVLGTALESTVVTAEYHDSSAIIVPDMRPFGSTLVVKYVAEYGVALSDVTLTLYTDYFIYPTHIVMYSHMYEGDAGRGRIKLSYTGGYTVATLPAPILDAIIKRAAYSLSLNQPVQPQTSIDRRLPTDIKVILDPYMRLRTP